jgi:hypothetical protein
MTISSRSWERAIMGQPAVAAAEAAMVVRRNRRRDTLLTRSDVVMTLLPEVMRILAPRRAMFQEPSPSRCVDAYGAAR